MFKGFRFDMRLTDERIVKFLAQQKDPISQSEIAARVGCSEITVLRSIKRLKGIVTPVGKGNRVPYTYLINTSELPDHLKAEIEARVG